MMVGWWDGYGGIKQVTATPRQKKGRKGQIGRTQTDLHEGGGAVDEGLSVHGLVLLHVRLGDLHVDVRLLRVGDRAASGVGMGRIVEGQQNEGRLSVSIHTCINQRGNAARLPTYRLTLSRLRPASTVAASLKAPSSRSTSNSCVRSV